MATNKLSGYNYKKCPLARLSVNHTGNGYDLITCDCQSPQRTGSKRVSDNATPVCTGAQRGGKRYTACPYYVRGAKAKDTGIHSTFSIRYLLGVLFCAGIMFVLADAVMRSGEKGSKTVGIIILILMVLAVKGMLKVSFVKDKNSGSKKKKTSKRKK